MRVMFAHELDEPGIYGENLVAGIGREKKVSYLSMNLSYSSPVMRFSGQPWNKY